MLGAQVFGFDLSPEAIKVANLKAQANSVSDYARFAVLDASNLALPSNKFDLVFGIEALHHVIFYSNVSLQLQRVMKPGGRAVFAENFGHNPILELFRNRFTMKAVETTLKYPDIEAFGKPFSQVDIYEISLLYMVKRLFRGKYDMPIVKILLAGLWHFDNVFLRLVPGARRFCGESVVVLVK
jgi:SAM-dependent methyltransferase